MTDFEVPCEPSYSYIFVHMSTEVRFIEASEPVTDLEVKFTEVSEPGSLEQEVQD